MLEQLKNEMNLTYTENGALTHRSSLNACLDLFFRSGGMRNASEKKIANLVIRAYAENPLDAMRILFFIRDIRGGMGERRFFRIAMQTLAAYAPEAVCKNAHLIPEYGRYDDLLILIGTPCGDKAVEIIRSRLNADLDAMAKGQPASLLAKWLPSVNATAAETRRLGKQVAKALGMRETAYRKTLSALRKYTDILENRLRVHDYTFDYAKQPSNAMLRYRAAFLRNDSARYRAYLADVAAGRRELHAGTLFPYEIVRACRKLSFRRYDEDDDLGEYDVEEELAGYPEVDRRMKLLEQREALDAAWNALPVYGASEENALVVVDGSGSMYAVGGSPQPIDAALSLGIYFAEHNKGAFANHFITFSHTPKLVEIMHDDIFAKVGHCMCFNDVANTDLEAVFRVLLNTAVKNRVPQEEMPAKLYIISDMEFDYAVIGGNSQPLYDTMSALYAEQGYQLPQIVFWNVASRHSNVPVTFNQTGTALVSGASPALFDLVASGGLDPMQILSSVTKGERYAPITV